MEAFIDLISEILKDGKWKENRTGVKTLVCPSLFFKHDMSKGFPLLTTKKMAYKTVRVELEGFIKGITDKRWFQERGCHIWDAWASPDSLKPYGGDGKNVRARKAAQKQSPDLGPIYGHQWRRFGNKVGPPGKSGVSDAPEDQLARILEILKKDPNDRTMVCSAWNPLQLTSMCLKPCHLIWGLVHIDGTLHLNWSQRSCDMMLGVPFNIASYATLLHIFCAYFDMTPGTLAGTFWDAHIYENHLDAAEIQVKRKPFKLPRLETPYKRNSLVEWQHSDTILRDYKSHDAIKMEVAV